MKNKQLSLISLGVLSLIVTGCNTRLRPVVTGVQVESVKMSDTGVMLDDIKAELYPVPVNDILYVKTKELAVATDVVAQDTLYADRLSAQTAESLTVSGTREMVALQPTLQPAVQVEVQPATLLNNHFHMITGKQINYALKSHLGSSYVTLLNQYNEAIAAKKSLDQIPSLKIEYRFRAVINGDKYSDYIHFSLKDAFANFGVLIHVNDKSEIITYFGNPLLMEKLEAAKLAAGTMPKVLANLFYPENKTEIFKISNSLYAGFELISGGKIWGFVPSVGAFKITDFGKLPFLKDNVRIATKRADSKLVSALGSAGYTLGLNHVLLFYVNSMGYVSNVFYANEYLVVKELAGSCAYFEKYGFLPLETKCQPSRVIEPIKVDSAVLQDSAIRQQPVLQLKQ